MVLRVAAAAGAIVLNLCDVTGFLQTELAAGASAQGRPPCAGTRQLRRPALCAVKHQPKPLTACCMLNGLLTLVGGGLPGSVQQVCTASCTAAPVGRSKARPLFPTLFSCRQLLCSAPSILMSKNKQAASGEQPQASRPDYSSVQVSRSLGNSLWESLVSQLGCLAHRRAAVLAPTAQPLRGAPLACLRGCLGTQQGSCLRYHYATTVLQLRHAPLACLQGHQNGQTEDFFEAREREEGPGIYRSLFPADWRALPPATLKARAAGRAWWRGAELRRRCAAAELPPGPQLRFLGGLEPTGFHTLAALVNN